MKGLILKELYLIKSFSKQYVLLMVLMGAWSVFVHNISFVAIYVMVLGSSMVLSTTSMDEAVSFHKFAVTMPVNARTLVKSKYVILFLTVAHVFCGSQSASDRKHGDSGNGGDDSNRMSFPFGKCRFHSCNV